MKFFEVKVGELPEFISSPEYLRLDIKPVSPLRAVSQLNNPFASPSDLALVYACEGANLLGFSGLLPDRLNNGHGFAASNTGWWVNPVKGSSCGLPLFMRALKGCNGKMFLTDCTEYTRQLLTKTGQFNFLPEVVGKRWFLRSYIGPKFRREGRNFFLTRLTGQVDEVVNSVFYLYRKSVGKRIGQSGYTLEVRGLLNESLSELIVGNSEAFYLRQDYSKLNWIATFPWLSTSPVDKLQSYPFSSFAEHFYQQFITISHDGKPLALFMLSVRDNHATLPYFYCNPSDIVIVAVAIRDYLVQIQVDSLIVFNHQLINAFDKIKLPSIYTTKIVRHAGYSNVLAPVFKKGRKFQDGEGDVAFT